MHVEPFSREELLARLRETRLVGFDGAQVYGHATLHLRAFDPADLTPAQRYVLMPGVRKILELRGPSMSTSSPSTAACACTPRTR